MIGTPCWSRRMSPSTGEAATKCHELTTNSTPNLPVLLGETKEFDTIRSGDGGAGRGGRKVLRYGFISHYPTPI